jgi:hypothetical protein
VKNLFKKIVNGIGKLLEKKSTYFAGTIIAQMGMLVGFCFWGYFILIKKEEKFEEFITG